MSTDADPALAAPRLRADAQRNRDRLVDAARSAFLTAADDADAVSLEGIARAAGVGIGTLYRHFPTREALVEALYEAELDDLTSLAPTLLAQHTGLEALAAWLQRWATFVATKRGVHQALQRTFTPSGTPAGATRARITATIGEFLAAGTKDGSLRADVAADDVTTSFVGAFLATRGSPDPDQVHRVLGLVLDGLRPVG